MKAKTILVRPYELKFTKLVIHYTMYVLVAASTNCFLLAGL